MIIINTDRDIQHMDDNLLNDYLDSQDEEIERDEDAEYDEDELALERDEMNEDTL